MAPQGTAGRPSLEYGMAKSRCDNGGALCRNGIYRGYPQLDDPENGFWYFAGYQDWHPEKIAVNLGQDWLYNYRMHYKPFPCCALFHGALDCFYELLEKNNLKDGEIGANSAGWAWTILSTGIKK